MSIEETIVTIKHKLEELKQIDSQKAIFGSSTHQYILGKVKTEQEIQKFEKKYGITLPQGYRQFLLSVGNGGAGPYYGLEPLEDSLYIDLDYKIEGKLLDPSRPFPITEPWNMSFPGDLDNEKEYKQFEEKYFDRQWINGLLRICNYGCAVFFNLVVNGLEYGNIWVDDRANDNGIYPDHYFGQQNRTEFLKWYELWLDKSLNEVKDERIQN